MGYIKLNKNKSMIGFSTPLKFGPAPRTELPKERLSKDKFEVVSSKGDEVFIRLNYQDE